ncbi:GldL-related protein [Ferruginibacter sp.]
MVSGIATFVTIFGAWAKLTHQYFADNLLTIGLWTLAISQSVYIYFKFVALKNKNE